MPDDASPPHPYPQAVPVLTDGVVRLRALAEGDLARLVEQCSDPQVSRLTTLPEGYVEANGRAFLDQVRSSWSEQPDLFHRTWAIEAPLGPNPERMEHRLGEPAMSPTRGFVGTIGCMPTSQHVADVGYIVHPSARGRGYATRALRLVTGQAFDVEGFTALHWRCVIGNWASWRVAWAVGFRLEGRIRRSLLTGRGQAVDGWLASLLVDDPRHPPEQPSPVEQALLADHPLL